MKPAQVEQFVEGLAALHGAGLDDRSRIDLVATLERLKGAAAAAQARVTVAFADSQLSRARAGRGASRRWPGARSAPRSRWPDARPPASATGTSDWPGRWSASSRTPWPP